MRLPAFHSKLVPTTQNPRMDVILLMERPLSAETAESSLYPLGEAMGNLTSPKLEAASSGWDKSLAQV